MKAKLTRQIIAIGGAALPPQLDNLKLVNYFLQQTAKKRPKVCFIGTAGGDAESGRLRFYAAFSQFDCRPTHLSLFARTPRDLTGFLLDQDAIFVGGGNTRSMLAVWGDWGLDRDLRRAWERGIVRVERGRHLLVRAGHHRFDRRPAHPPRMPGLSCRKLLSALRQRARAPPDLPQPGSAGRHVARRRRR